VKGPFLRGLVLAGLAATAGAQDEFSVVASKGGFKPVVVNVHKGESVRLNLTTADVEHCFALDAFRIEKKIVPGKTTKVDFTPDRTGSFPFYCCLEPTADAIRGRIVVAE
jgi:cytochrome c oxidase subunit 2